MGDESATSSKTLSQVRPEGEASPPAHALLVEDDRRIRAVMATTLEEGAFRVTQAGSVAEARKTLAEDEPDLVVTDLRLPDGTGIEILERAKSLYPDLPIVVMTAYGTVETAVEAMHRGAHYFLVKPFLMDQLLSVARGAVETRRLRHENVYLRARMDEELHSELVGKSAAIEGLRTLIGRVAPMPSPVLITGESGVGKEIVARLIHEMGPRSAKPFVRINCAAIPRDLLESEFFGHRKGAFTGAANDRRGAFQLANRGTLFLDEVSSLHLELQPKLLRVLEDGEIRSVGSDESVRVDVRIVAATNQDLRDLSGRGLFRQDLYFRLNVFPIDIPPLRERRSDIPLLVEHSIPRICRRLGRPVLAMGPGTVAMLARHDWPGNVRELQNLLERAIILTSGSTIGADALLPLGTGPLQTDESDADGKLKDSSDLDLARAQRALEISLVREALRRSHGVKKDAAKLLGVSQRALSYYLAKHGIG